MRKVAVFDIDGTIFRSSLLVELVEILITKGIFPKEATDIYRKEEHAWRNRKGEYSAYIDKVVKAFMQYIKGVEYDVLLDAADELVYVHKDRVYRYTRDLIMDLKKKGYYLLAISHSPKVIVDRFCNEIGFDKVYGFFYEIGPTDRFTGVVADEHLIRNKANIVKRAVEKEDLTLDGSIGVGDTESDLPFLELVETAICFNPNAELYKHARRNKWRVIVERKDVIYTIQ